MGVNETAATAVPLGIAALRDGCTVLYGEWLTPISVVIASSAVTQLLGVVAAIVASPRRFSMLTIWFPRGSGFLNLGLVALQLVHFGLICWGLSHYDAKIYALFSGWDIYTLFVLRTTNCGLFSNAFTLVTTLLGDRHVDEGALNSYGARDRDNAYAILASAVHAAGAVVNDARAEAVAASNAAVASGAGPGSGVLVVERDDDTVEFVSSASVVPTLAPSSRSLGDTPDSARSASEDTSRGPSSDTRRLRGGAQGGTGDRLLEWVHGSRRLQRGGALPTKSEFVGYRGDVFTRARRWVAGAIWLTLLPALLTHVVPGLAIFPLFLVGGLVTAVIVGGIARLVFLRCLDPLAARAAARVIERVAAAHVASVASGGRADASGSTVSLPRYYPCVTPCLGVYVCIRALALGALGSVAQLLFAALVHHAVIVLSMPIPLRADQYWAVTEAWWGLLSARCYASSLVAESAAVVASQSAPDVVSRHAVAFASYFL